jgi:predicted transcriptional regulator
MDFEKVKQNKIPFCVTLSEELSASLDKLADQQQTTKARIVRAILDAYFKGDNKNGKVEARKSGIKQGRKADRNTSN